MLNNVAQARTRKFVEFGVLCIMIPQPGKGHIPATLMLQLEGFRLPLEAIRADRELGKLAANRLEVLDELLLYCKAANADDEKQARRHFRKAQRLHNKGDRIADKIRKER